MKIRKSVLIGGIGKQVKGMDRAGSCPGAAFAGLERAAITVTKEKFKSKMPELPARWMGGIIEFS